MARLDPRLGGVEVVVASDVDNPLTGDRGAAAAFSHSRSGDQRITKGPGSRAAGVAMAFKLIESAQARWRAVNAPTSSLWSVPAQGSRRGSSSVRQIRRRSASRVKRLSTRAYP